MFFVLSGALEFNLLILELRLGTVGIDFGVFLWLQGRTLDPFFYSSGKGSKKVQKRSEKGSWNGCISHVFLSFPENAKVRFDCAGVSGLRFRPLVFWLCASIFALPFLHRFFEVFGPPRGPQKSSF